MSPDGGLPRMGLGAPSHEGHAREAQLEVAPQGQPWGGGRNPFRTTWEMGVDQSSVKGPQSNDGSNLLILWLKYRLSDFPMVILCQGP